MKRNTAVALGVAVGSFAIAGSAFAQRTPITPPTGPLTAPQGTGPVGSPIGDPLADVKKKQQEQVGYFETSFSVSQDSGKTWHQGSGGGFLPSSICPSGGTTSLCAAGTKPYAVYIRFPGISTAADLADVGAQIGRTYRYSTPHYYSVDRVDSLSTKGTICSSGLVTDRTPWVVGQSDTPTPSNPQQILFVNLATPWVTPQTGSDPSITCVWEVVAGVYDQIIKRPPVHVLRSNQVRMDFGRR
jgi:hypothetical protein